MSKKFLIRSRLIGFLLVLIGVFLLISLIIPPWILILIIAFLLICFGCFLFYKDGGFKI